MFQSHPIFLGGMQGDYIRRETWISAVINMVMSSAFFYALFGTIDPVPIWGASGFAFDFLPQSFICGLLSALIPGIMAGKRVAGGTVEPLARGTRRWPRSAVGLSLVLATASMLVFAGLAMSLLIIVGLEALDFTSALVVKILLGGLIGVIVTPLAIHAAMTKRR